MNNRAWVIIKENDYFMTVIMSGIVHALSFRVSRVFADQYVNFLCIRRDIDSFLSKEAIVSWHASSQNSLGGGENYFDYTPLEPLVVIMSADARHCVS